MRVTLKDVARTSGVSLQTASQILRGNAQAYRPATREKVLRTARQLQYEPDLAGRMLAGGSTMTVGLIAKALGGAVNVSRLRTAVKTARQHRYLTYVVNIEQPGDNSEQVIEAARQLIGRRVDGLLIDQSTPLNDKAQAYLTRQTIPIVFIDWAPRGWGAHIRFDLDRGIHELAEHLKALGHRRVVKFFSPAALDYLEYRMVRFKRAFDARGIEMLVNERWMLRSAQDVEARAYDAVQRFLMEQTGVTALMMNNDHGAIGALAAIHDAGLSVPGDLSVVGFDDIVAARFYTPALTTIRGPDPKQVGHAAFDMLHRLMTGAPRPAEPMVMATSLVVRESTAGPCTRERARLTANQAAQRAARRGVGLPENN